MPNSLGSLLSGALEGAVESVKGIPQAVKMIVQASPILGGNAGPAAEMITDALVKMTPEQRRFAIRHALQHTGEIAGATAGAVSGSGVASVPLAGGGAVAGHALGDYVATLLGQPQEKPMSGQEGLHEAGKIFGGNAAATAAGEAVANFKNVVPMARRAAVRTKNAVRRPFTPSAEQAQTNAIADRLNVPMTLAQRSGRKIPQITESALDVTPTGSGVIRAARERAQAGAEDALGRAKDKLSPNPVSPDSFVAGEAKNSLATQRAGLDADVNAAADAAGTALHPSPQTPHEGGAALASANDSAWSRFKSAAAAKFQPFLRDYGDLPVDVSALRGAARELLTNEIPPAGQSYFPSGTLKQLKQLAGMEDAVQNDMTAELDKVAQSLGGKSAAELDPGLQSRLREQLEKQGLKDTSTPPQMSLQQLMELRSRLLEMGRSINSNTPGLTRRALGKVRSSVEDSIDAALAGDPAHQQFRDMNSWYRENIGRLDNDAAGIIKGTDFPEDIVTKNKIAQPGADERVQQAYQSTHLANEPPPADALGKFQRANFDQAADAARVDTGMGPIRRLSPQKFRQYLQRLTPRTTDAVYGPGAPLVNDVASPSLIAREGELHGSPLANAIDTGNAQTVMGKAFPKQNPESVQDAIQFFDRTGDTPALRRASLQNLEDRSLATDRNIDATKRYVDFDRLERQMGPGTGWGNSTDAMFGPVKQDVNDVIRVGKSLGAPAKNFGNTSRTAHATHAVQTGLAGVGAGWATFTGHPWAIPAFGALAALPYATAKAVTNPRLARWLTEPAQALPALAPASGQAAGFAARVPFAVTHDDLKNLPEPKKPDWFDLNAPPDGNDDWFERNKPPE